MRKPSRFVRIGSALAALASGAMLVAPLGAYANPVGPSVVSGSASFNASGSTLTVTNSPSTIINWQGFSIGSSETTSFVQQSAASAVLNRVTGPDGSQILGALQSNGQVFIINPAGVFIGAGARVDVAGLVASTLNLSDQDFLANKLNFSAAANAGAVTNQGAITTPLGGSVILVGNSVSNSGLISAPNGNVVLAAGQSVTLGDTAAPNVLAQIQAPGNQAVNLGQISVNSGQVGIYGGLVKQSGIVSANGVGTDAGGNIVFKAMQDVTLDAGSVTSANGTSGGSVRIEATGGTNLVSGNVSATGSSGAGGSVALLGQNVGVSDNAVIDASGASGGGSILVGGDLHGANASLMNANAVFTGANTVLRADATDNGNGGTVVLWSEQTTRAYGSISARGGANGGNGGFVETSSKGYLDVLNAPTLGAGGTWLLDPSDISVEATTGDIDGTTPNFYSTIGTSTVSNSAITGVLDTGGSVSITTNSTAGAPLGGTITVNAPIATTAGGIGTTTASLSLLADNNIIINSPISVSAGGGTLNTTLTANQFGAKSAATITVANTGSIATNGGSLTANQTLIGNGTISTANETNTAWGALNVAAAQFNAPLTAGDLTATGDLKFGAGTHTINGALTDVDWSLHNLTTTLLDGATLVLKSDVNWVDNLVTTPGATGVAIQGPGTATGSWIQVQGASGFTANSAGSGQTSFSGLQLTGVATCYNYGYWSCYSFNPTPVTIAGGTLALTGNTGYPGTIYASTLTLGSINPAQITGTGGVVATADFLPSAGSSINMTQSPSGTPVGSYVSSVNLTQQSGTAPGIPITADDVSLTAAGTSVVDPAIGSYVSANRFTLQQGTGDLTLSSPITADIVYLYANGAGSRIVLNSTLTADSVGLVSDAGAMYSGATILPRSGARLTDFSLSQYSGDLSINVPIDADNVSLSASSGSILHGAGNPVDVTANSLSMDALYGSIGTSAVPILTSVSSLSASTSSSAPGAGGIYVSNTLASGALSLVSATSGENDIKVVNNTDILLQSTCGDGCSPGVQSQGGTITIQSTTGNIASNPNQSFYVGPAWVSATRKVYGQANASGGTINLSAAGNIDLPSGTIETNGDLYYLASDYTAGNGGAINLSAGGFVNIGSISAKGASTPFYGTAWNPAPTVTPTLSGGNGGSVAITAVGDVTVGTADVSGGAAVTATAYNGSTYATYYGTVEAGGNAGNITINSGGNLNLTGNVTANGGAGGQDVTTNGGAGGFGGTIKLSAAGTALTVGSSISANGGAGATISDISTPGIAGAGGKGGSILISGASADVTINGTTIEAIGGNGGSASLGTGGDAGAGGVIDIGDGGKVGSLSVTGYGILGVVGGIGGAGATQGGRGGDAGTVTAAASGSITIDGSYIEAGNGEQTDALIYGAGEGGSGGVGGAGGNGGTVSLTSDTGISVTNAAAIDVTAGRGGSGGNSSAAAGVTGSITLSTTAGGVAIGPYTTLYAEGVSGASAGGGVPSPSGDGGTISLSGADGVSIDAGAGINAVGGDGYSNGGAAGKGGSVSIQTTNALANVSALGSIMVSGGVGGGASVDSGAGGDGGNVSIVSAGDVATGLVMARGGDGGIGGKGGMVSTTSAGTTVIQQIDVTGGSSTMASSVALGGNGGALTVNSGGDVTLGSWDGTYWSGGLYANGGSGGTTATVGGAGGVGGQILIQGNATVMNVMSAQPISAAGGAGGTAAQTCSTACFYLGNGGDGGAGGIVTIKTIMGGTLAGAFGSPIDVHGADGGIGTSTGNGGKGGSVTLSSLDGSNGAGGISIGALRADSLYGGLTINAAGGAGTTAGLGGDSHLLAGGGGIGQITTDGGASVASNVPLEIGSGGTVNLINPANNLQEIYGGVTAGDLSVANSKGIALGDAALPASLSASGNIGIAVPHGAAAPNDISLYQPLTAGGDITLTADYLDFPVAGTTLTSGKGAANYIAFLPLVDQELNGGPTADAFSTPNLRIGDSSTTASILFGSSTTTPTSLVFDYAGSLSIRTRGNVTQNAPIAFSAGNTAGIHGLQVSAGDVQLTDSGNSFAVLAGGTNLANSTPGAFNVVNSGGFTVGAVDGVNGVSGSLGGAGSLTVSGASGSIDIASGLATSGAWAITAPAGVNNLAGSTIDVNSSMLAVSGTLANAGTIQLDNDAAGATLAVSGTLANQATGLIHSMGSGAAANTMTLGGSAPALDNQGGIQVDQPLIINASAGSVDLNGGALSIAAGQNLAANTTLVNWNAGAIAGATGSTFTPSSVFSIGLGGAKVLSGPDLSITTASLSLNDQLNIVAGTLNVAGNVNVNAGGLLSLDGGTLAQSAGSFVTLLGGTTIFNGGAYTKPAGTVFDNGGTVNVNAGILALDAGDGGLGGGAYILGAGAGLALNGGTYAIGSLAGAGTFDVTAGAANVASATLTGATTLSGGAVNLAGGSVGAVNVAAIAGSQFNVSGNSTIGAITNAGTVNVTGGTSTLASVANSGVFNLQGGSINLGGSFDTLAGGTTNLNGGGFASTSAFGNAGTVNVNAGGLTLDGGDGGTNGGVYNIASGAVLSFAAGGYTLGGIANSGTLGVDGGAVSVLGNMATLSGAATSLNAGGLTLQSSSIFGNAGTVKVNAGTLALNAGDGTLSGGAYNIAAGSTLALTGGTYGIGNVTGAGRFEVSGATANVTNASLTGSTAPDGAYLSAGALNVTGTGTIAWFDHSGGTLDGNGTGSLTVTGYNNPTGAGLFGTTGFADVSLTSAGNLTVKGSNLTASGALVLDSTGGRLWIDGATVSGGNVTLAGNWVQLMSSTAATSQVSAANLTVNAPTLLNLDGTNGAAKLTATGTMTIDAGAVDVLAGAYSASIDPTTLTLSATGDVTLAGGSGANAAASVSGGGVSVSAANVTLKGGSGSSASAAINATSGNLVLDASGSLTLAAGLGNNSDAVLTAGAGSAQVTAFQCGGCNVLAALTTASDAGAYALNGVTFKIIGAIVPDSSVVQANSLAGSAGSGTSNVSNQPASDDDQSQTNGDENGNKGKNKKLPTCSK